MTAKSRTSIAAFVLVLGGLWLPAGQLANAGPGPGDQPQHRQVDLAAVRGPALPGKHRSASAKPESAKPESAKPESARPAVGVPGDVTGDGLADAVVRDPGPDNGTLRLYTHNGSSTSNPWTEYLPSGGAWDFADLLLLGDVTGDDRADLVARDPSVAGGSLWIYPNNGATAGNPWTERVAAGTGWNTLSAIMLGDVTGDGHPDLVAREQGASAGTMWIYPHSGAATGDPWTLPRVWAGTGWNLANVLLLDDVTGDGHRDIIVRDGSGSLWIYPHDGVTSGNPYTRRYAAGTGWNLADVLLVGDATGDGHPDLVARDPSGDLWVYPHNGSATSNPYTVSRFAAGTGWGDANALVLGDATGDGRPDILGRIRAGDVWVYPNDGTTAPWTSRFAAGTRWAFENQLLLGDVTGDGRPDLLARDPAVADGTLWVYPHDGSTSSDPWKGTREFAGTGWNLATAMVLGDLTGDGWPDLVVRDRAGDLWVYPHNGLATGGNHWSASRTWAGTGWNTAVRIALGDVDGDGKLDLVDQEKDGSLWVYRTGSSAAPLRIDGDWTTTTALVVADVRGTGRPDLVTRDESGALWIHPHDGSAGTNPWITRQAAGTGWGFASTLLL